MPAVYSHQLYADMMPVGPSRLVTVPDGERWVLRDFSVANRATESEILSIWASRAGLELDLFISTTFAPDSIEHWQGRVVLNAGDELAGYSQGDKTSLIASGYRFLV